ncbi:CarD family transcriptional regulator [Alkaliphilus sp. MSJ-5]|uniref:CarD family transcriptional regulator n=1 Tax=Alkaliphilus flagellatus TaxID=2841507 RepID=A0ABS6G711_9FIRM|nr:CarD family transcriptional regulator [Alkaliphilus flagellatus]MBU5678164.1 CarD family transcriptional regulator [Alkaliphilus flagellatus]
MFNIGEKVVYPMHGAGVIESIEEREILGERRKYYIMRMPIGDMKVMIPLDQIDDIGIRKVIDSEEIENVLDVLASDTTKMHQNWNRRYRANMDLIKTGDVYEIAEVVRNLTLMDKEKGLSTGERKMLSNARQILISEIVLVAEVSEEEASNLVESVILQQTVPDTAL